MTRPVKIILVFLSFRLLLTPSLSLGRRGPSFGGIKTRDVLLFSPSRRSNPSMEFGRGKVVKSFRLKCNCPSCRQVVPYSPLRLTPERYVTLSYVGIFPSFDCVRRCTHFELPYYDSLYSVSVFLFMTYSGEDTPGTSLGRVSLSFILSSKVPDPLPFNHKLFLSQSQDILLF